MSGRKRRYFESEPDDGGFCGDYCFEFYSKSTTGQPAVQSGLERKRRKSDAEQEENIERRLQSLITRVGEKVRVVL